MARRGMRKHGKLKTPAAAGLSIRGAVDETPDYAAMATRDITTRGLSLRAESLNDADRSVEAVLSTDTPTLVVDWSRGQGEVIEEILVATGMRAAAQVILLESHWRWSVEAVLGSVRSLQMEASHVRGRLHFATNHERADVVWNLVRQRHVNDVSVGYRSDEYTDIPAGGSAVIEGRKYQANRRTLRVTTKWTLREVSVVPIGADEYAKMRSATNSGAIAPGQTPGGGCRHDGQSRQEMIMTFEQWLRNRNIDPATLTAERRAELQVEFTRACEGISPPAAPAPALEPAPVPVQRAAQPAAPAAPAPVDPAQVAAEAIRCERQRITAIRELAGDDVPAELVQRAMSEGWDQARASQEFLAAIRAGRPAPVAAGGGSPRVVGERIEGLRRAIADSIVMGRCPGRAPTESTARTEAEQFRGIGLHDMARVILAHEGGGSRAAYMSPDDLFTRSISTFTLANVLGDVSRRVLQARYEEAPGTFEAWAGEREAKDFRSHDEIKFGMYANLNSVGNAGEMEHSTLTDSKESYSVDTRGTRLTLTRKQFINDDLGAFLRIPEELGAAVKRDLDDLAYAYLVSASGLGPTMGEDSQVLFYASRTTPNYFTGATTVLSDSSLASAKQLLRKLVGPTSQHLNLMPRHLLVPPELEHDAQKLVKSGELMMVQATPTTGAAEKTYFPTKNVHQGTLDVIVEPRLSAGTNGTTAWYLVCDARQQANLVVVYLRGNRGPTLERKDPVDVLGIGWWIWYDIGVGVVDWRGIVRSKGAA